MFKKLIDFFKNQKRMMIPVSIVAVLAVVGIVLFLVIGGKSNKLAFSEDMITESVVNEMCDISDYVINPKGKILKLTATYKDEAGLEKQWLVAGMAFKPTKVGETFIKVEADDGETIETVIQITEGAPTLVTTKEANFYLEETIQLADLMEYVEYKSTSKPKFKVLSLIFGADTIDMSGEKEYTFKEIGNYAFEVEISNSAGSSKGTIIAKVMPEMTENEKDDLTNNINLAGGAQVTKALDKEFHSENSDWSWKVTANPRNVWDNEQTSNYYMSSFTIDFGQEIDISQYYFVMDIFANENTAGIGIHYINSAGMVAPLPMGFQDILGKWTQISSFGKQKEGLYTGLYIMVLHSKDVGQYDASDVTVWFDNMKLYQYPDPNAPILVGGTTEYDITSSKVTWNSRLEDNGSNGNYVQFNKAYTNQTLTFTTTIKDAKKPNLTLGARMDGANTFLGANTGLLIKFYNEFFEVYTPKFGEKLVGASNVLFESGKKYTFAYSVETLGGQDMLFLKIHEVGGNEILNYSLELPKDTVNTNGNFVIWSTEAEMTIEYKEPATIARKANVNVVVPESGKAGTAGISTATPDAIDKAAYLALEGDYTKEQFTFTTTIEDGNKPNLVIGARMKGLSSNPFTHEGVTIRVYNEFFEVYAPKYGTIVGAQNLWLTSGKTYTFKVSVSEKGVLNFMVEEAGSAILNYQLKDIKGIPSNGSFMVWSLNEDTDITYQMPAVAVIPTNKNVEVEKDGNATTVTLETIEPNVIAKSSYLAMKGDYTNETFAFTTKIANAEKPNLIIGARMKGVDSYVGDGNGVMIQLYKNFYEVYGEKYGFEYLLGAANYDTVNTENTLAVGVDYTFEVQVIDGKLVFTIRLGETVVHSKTYDVPENVAESGNFMVWNADAKRSISYQMPVYVEPLVNKNKIVESTESSGTAVLETVEQGKRSYLAMKGDYTNETFTFKTTINNPEKPNLIIGLHMPEISYNPSASQGVWIDLNNFFYAFYAPEYGNNIHAAWYSATGGESWRFETGVEYTFVVWIENNTLYFEILQGEDVVHSASKELPTGASESGSFVVWNLETTRTITYEMPVVVQPQENTNMVVESTGEAGTAQLKTIDANMLEAASYLAMQGDYTDEIFTFKTKITDAEKPNLVIGAHIKDVDGNVESAEGIIIRLNNFFYAVYGPDYAEEDLIQAAWYSSTGAESWRFDVDKEYTFTVQVKNNQIIFTVKDGDTLIHTASYDIPNTVAASGNFMVWNMDAERSIRYEMPVKETPTVPTGAALEVEGTSGSAALQASVVGNIENMAYLITKTQYTTETFEVTTTIEKDKDPSIWLGTRINSTIETPYWPSIYGYKGVLIGIHNNFYVVYSPTYGSNEYAKNYGTIPKLEGTYTFGLTVDENNNILFTVTQNGSEVYSDTITGRANIPVQGRFVVCTTDNSRAVDWSITQEVLVAESAITIPAGTMTGKVALKAAAPDNIENLGYLATASKFSVETFEFTTTIAEGENPNLILGARVNSIYYPSIWGVGSGVGGQGAVMIALHSNFYELYSPSWGNNAKAANYYSNQANLSGTYKFAIKVVTVGGNSTCYFTVSQGDTIVHNAQYDVGNVLQETGNFVIWSRKGEHTIRYWIKEDDE